MILLIAFLSVLRREGMYFVLLGPILLLLAYWDNSNKKNAIEIIIFFIIAELIVNIPILYNGMSEKGGVIDAALVHIMAEPSFDRTKATKELEILNNEYDIEIIDRWNTDYGLDSYDSNYFDNEGWMDNYYYIHRSDSNVSYEECKKALIQIIINQPKPFVVSRIKAYLVAGRGEKSWNLYVPLMFLFIEVIYSILKFKKKTIFLFLGLIVHISITTLALPASFFKYYFQMWLIAYVFLIIILIDSNYTEKTVVSTN